MFHRSQFLVWTCLIFFNTQLMAGPPAAMIKSLLVNVDIESSDEPVGDPEDYDTLNWHVAANIVLFASESSHSDFIVTIYNSNNTIFKSGSARVPAGDIEILNVESMGLVNIPQLPLTVKVFSNNQVLLTAPMNIEQDLEYGLVTLVDLVLDNDPVTNLERFRGFQDREWNFPINYPESRIKYWDEQIDAQLRSASPPAELADNIGGSSYYEFDAVISPVNVAALQTSYDPSVFPHEVIKQLSMRWTFMSWTKQRGKTVLQGPLWIPHTGTVSCRYTPKP